MADAICASCMDEARMDLGIYHSGAKVPKHLVRKLADAYDDQHYVTHEKRD